MEFDKKKELNQDILFFFLLVITSLISLYIVIEKEKNKNNNFNNEKLSNLFKFNRYLIIIIDIYFVINSYNNLINLINNNANQKTIDDQIILLIANISFLIGALLFIPLTKNDSITIR